MLRRFASNALANLTTGISSTFYQVGPTAIASRSFDSRGFAAWSLAVSLSALVPLFSISLSQSSRVSWWNCRSRNIRYCGCSVLPGVTLGDHCVVGTRSVVTHSFPPYSMIDRSPARLIKTFNPMSGKWESGH